MYFLAPTSISTISPDLIIVAKTCAKNSGTCSAIWLDSIVLTTLVFSLVRNFPTTFYLYLPGARAKFFLASVISFYWSHVLWKITPSERFFYFRKLFTKSTCWFSFCFGPNIFVLLLIHSNLICVLIFIS